MAYCYEHGLQRDGDGYCPVCHKAVLAEPPADAVVEVGQGAAVSEAVVVDEQEHY